MAQHRPPDEAGSGDGDGGDGLDARARAVAAAGRAAYPAVALPPERLAAQLARRAAAGSTAAPDGTAAAPKGPAAAAAPAPAGAAPQGPATAAPAHAADLYLACACAEGLPSALRLLEERVLSQIPAAVAHLRAGPDFAEDVRLQVRERLLLGSAEGPPRITAYEGRGPLGGWVRAMALRLALNLREKKDEHAAHPGEQVIEKLVGATCDPELEILKARYRDAFRAAVRDAAAQLPDEQRAVLHLYLVEGLGTQRIGALYNVNHSTVSRWMQAARDAIFARTRQLLQERLGVRHEEFQSLVRLLQSQLDVSLAGVLGQD